MKPNAINCAGSAPPTRGYLRAGTISLSYLEWGGAGRPLLLLHGITSNAWAWWRVAPALAAQGYHVYALDMPGHGESDETHDHHMDQLGALAGAALRELALTEVTLIGHSWGGATALALASGADALHAALSRVVLVDPALHMEPLWGAGAVQRFLTGVGMDPHATIAPLSAAYPDWQPCDVYWKAEALWQCRAEAVYGFFAGSGAWDLTPRLAEVAVPLLLLVADLKYTVIAPAMLAEAQRMLRPGLGQTLILPGVNHNMYRGGFDAFMRELLAWLSE